MSKRNYSQCSKKNTDSETMIEEATNNCNTTPTVEVKMESKPTIVIGRVAGCKLLNVRQKPISNSDIVCVLEADTKVKVELSRSTNEWFKITTGSGIKGYCMRSFVSTNP